ncbi:MAG: molybdopterin molybdotransferase MoeA [Xanthobacteraceae bacterium]|nr:molybdopterin molybdotransferase MoeA [Xanthobacteraceae bacterium]
MAQLTDDCFAFSGPLMPLDEMERLIEARVAPVGEREVIPLAQARGRVVARDVIAPVDLPHFDNSAVDGYAVRHADLNPDAETSLTISSRVMAGQTPGTKLGSTEAIRIFTGAPMPADSDTVFMQEDVREEGGRVIVPSGLKRGANRRLAGEDLRKSSTAIPAGRVLDAQNIALAAALGVREIEVTRRIRVAIFSTGNEVVEAGEQLTAAGVFDANRALLRELLARLGCEVADLGILRDDPAKLSDALRKAAAANDLVVTTGGVSTGEADYVKDAVESIGSLTFWRIAIKPGRPVAMGVIRGTNGESAAFAGLPGNPVAAFVTFVRVVRPLVLRLAGATPKPFLALPVIAAFDYKKKTGRREYVRVALRPRADGSYDAIKHPQDGAGVITSLTETDGLVELPEDVTRVAAGERVRFLSYASLTS